MPRPGTAPVYYPSAVAAVIVVPYSSEMGPLPPENLSAVDARAMEMATLASVIGLVAVIATYILPYAFGASVFGVSYSTSHLPAQSAFAGLIALTVVGGAISCVQFWFWRKAFKPIAEHDPGLKTPAGLSLLAIIGAAMVIAGLAWLLGVLSQWVQCANGVTPIPTNCITFGPAIGALALLVIGGIIAFVGLIGIWLGLWRFGTRYKESMFKIGMFCIIFPFIDIAGFILLILAARAVRARVTTRPMAALGQGPLPPT